MARLKGGAGPLLGLSSIPTITKGEAATQTFTKGAVVVYNGAGYIEEAGVNPSQIAGMAQQPGQNGTNAGDKECRFIPALPHVQFEMALDQAGGLGRVTVQGDLGEEYGLTKDANGVWYVDVDKTGANARVKVVGFRDAVGTASGRVYVVFKNSATLFA